MMGLYTVNENGQMEINFEALELKTSEKFSADVNYAIEYMGYKLKKVVENRFQIAIYLENNGLFEIYVYSFNGGTIANFVIADFMIDQLNMIRGVQ